jgi:hypothetical protein
MNSEITTLAVILSEAQSAQQMPATTLGITLIDSGDIKTGWQLMVSASGVCSLFG